MSPNTRGNAPSVVGKSSNDELTELAAIGKQHIAAGIGRMTNFVFSSAKGSRVTLDDGRTLLDFTCGIGVTNLGHCHPVVSKAAADQCMKLVHGQPNIAFNEPSIKLIQALKPVMPHPSLDTFFFWNSGSEAVEAAIKLARHATKRQNIIVMQGSYHGRTFGAMALTKSKTIYSAGYCPVMPGVFTAPFPYATQMGLSIDTSTDQLVDSCLFHLDVLLKQQTTPGDTAAILIEPVLGEGGYVPAPKRYLEGLRNICDQHGILLIIDEVQSGFGRTGTYFNIEQSGVRPDILICAKGIANGLPLSAIVSSKELMDRQPTGSMGGTYGFNAVSCSAAIACAHVMKEEHVLQNVRERSGQIFKFLRRLQEDEQLGHAILDVRGRGLMVGVEFSTPDFPITLKPTTITTTATTANNHHHRNQKLPSKLASKVAQACVERGLLILSTSMFEVIRFIPALNITKEELDEGLHIFEDSLRSLLT